MKKIFYILLVILGFGQIHAQTDVRATCKSSGLKIQAWVKATSSPVIFNLPSGTNTVGLIIPFSLPANGMPLGMAPIPSGVSCLFPSLNISHYTTTLVNNRYLYTYYANAAQVPGLPATWPVNTEILLMELTFTATANGKIPRLDNLVGSGGPNGFDYFYVEINGNTRSDTEGTPFYPAAIAYGGGDTYVQAITPLPITLVSFRADKFQERSSHLTWATASESNSSHFIVQSSTDKKSWTNLGSVKAAGNSQIIENYEFFDYNVYNGRDSRLTVYYRLQMVDLDGQVKTSPAESVVFGNGIAPGRDFVVYPNPASDGVQVEWDANRIDQPTALEFYDVQGKLVYTQKVSDNTNQEYIDFGQTTILPGLYLLRILNGQEPLDFKQIVVGQR